MHKGGQTQSDRTAKYTVDRPPQPFREQAANGRKPFDRVTEHVVDSIERAEGRREPLVVQFGEHYAEQSEIGPQLRGFPCSPRGKSQGKLGGDALGRSSTKQRRLLRDGGQQPVVEPEPENVSETDGAEHAERIVGEDAVGHGHEPPFAQVAETSKGIYEDTGVECTATAQAGDGLEASDGLEVGGGLDRYRHGVHREIPLAEIVEKAAASDPGDVQVGFAGQHAVRGMTFRQHKPGNVQSPRYLTSDRTGIIKGDNVEIGGETAELQVADAAAYEPALAMPPPQDVGRYLQHRFGRR